MRGIILVMLLGSALFFSTAWYAGLLENLFPVPPGTTGTSSGVTLAPRESLGDDLYPALKFPRILPPKSAVADPIVLLGVMNPMNVEEVPSPTTGQILFIGEAIDESVVQVAGSLPFLAEPYYFAPINAGPELKFVKFYRRIYEGDTVLKYQMLAMLEPAEALGAVLEKVAKIAAAEAEQNAAKAGENEGLIRLRRADKLLAEKVIAPEEWGTAQLTWIKLKNEHISKGEAVKLTRIEKVQADIKLHKHEIRALMPYERYIVKTIVKQQGYAVKQTEPILVVQNLERMLAEALIEEQYFARLKKTIGDRNLARGEEKEVKILATIEPTLIESPTHELLGHRRDITSVAVAKDMKIVSGSDDGTVCVWSQQVHAPLRQLDHGGAAVLVVACTPTDAKENRCLAGCSDGSIYLWDLNSDSNEPLKKIEPVNAHGKDVAITSLAFSPHGTTFASGGADGTIKLWTTEVTVANAKEPVPPEYAKEKYPFVPANGVASRHEDAVTSLHFTPQCRLVSAGRDKTLRVWQLKEKGAFAEGKTISHREGNVPHLGVSPDGKWMLFDTITGRTLQLLSVQDQKMFHTLSTAANATPFDTLAVFSPDSSMILTAGAPEGRLQLWRTPDETTRGYEVRQFATKTRTPVSCAAFSPDAGKGGPTSFAVSASGPNLYLWSIPTKKEVDEHRIERVPLTLNSHNIDANTRQIRIGFEVTNQVSERYPNGRFEAGRPVTIVID